MSSSSNGEDHFLSVSTFNLKNNFPFNRRKSIQRGRRRKDFGEDIEDDETLEEPESPPDYVDCSLTDVLTTAITDRLPNWGSWFPSLSRINYITVCPPGEDGFGYLRNSLSESHSFGGRGGNRISQTVEEEEYDNGSAAYLLVASGEDLRHRDPTIGLMGKISQILQLALPFIVRNLLQVNF